MNMHSNDYLKNQIATASREQLLIMFYDGAIRFVGRAKQAIKGNDIEGRNYGIQKASAIISELAATLDHDIGGEIAANLDALYSYMLNELNTANVKNDITPLEIVEKLLTDLRQTWVKAIELNKKEKTATAPEATAVAAQKPAQVGSYQPLSVSL